jgi:hypothetical protein
MSFVPVNPRPFLQDLVNKDVVVRLKWGETEYKGRLVVRYPPFPFPFDIDCPWIPCYLLWEIDAARVATMARQAGD